MTEREMEKERGQSAFSFLSNLGRLSGFSSRQFHLPSKLVKDYSTHPRVRMSIVVMWKVGELDLKFSENKTIPCISYQAEERNDEGRRALKLAVGRFETKIGNNYM